ncbi:MAG TPA: class I SAM-dependent methyltransferase [Solirubrobacteraceae bacterium]|nr:class I SAM-dependent methyltransferase [Solirubrobacteraceae bacterium]
MRPLAGEDIEGYAERHSSPPIPALRALAEETHRTLASPQMLTGPIEGRLLELLVFASGARRVLEIGTFSGYSALAMAAGLPTGGQIITCEISPEHAAVARRHFQTSPHAGRIDLREGPALETIAALDGLFDLVFIDADKPAYGDYYEAVLPRLSPRGLIVVDNTLWSGRVLDPDPQDTSSVAMAAFNDRVVSDPRVTCVMLTVRDGVTLIRRAPS